MARYVIDAPTLLQLLDYDLHVDPSHQLVAPNAIRSEALQLLLETCDMANAPTSMPWKRTNA